MRVEISIAKEKAAKMPKGSMEALKDEMTRRVSKQYDDVEVIVKTASNDGLSVLWATDKKSPKNLSRPLLKMPGRLLTTGLCVSRCVNWRQPPGMNTCGYSPPDSSYIRLPGIFYIGQSSRRRSLTENVTTP